jgi:hypothetical protein
MLPQLQSSVIFSISSDITLSPTLSYPTAVMLLHPLSIYPSLCLCLCLRLSFSSFNPSQSRHLHNSFASTSPSQVVSSSSLPSYIQNNFGSQRVPGSSIPYSADHSVALIISFPSKFPSQGSPSFTIRGSGVSRFYRKNCCSALTSVKYCLSYSLVSLDELNFFASRSVPFSLSIILLSFVTYVHL